MSQCQNVLVPKCLWSKLSWVRCVHKPKSVASPEFGYMGTKVTGCLYETMWKCCIMREMVYTPDLRSVNSVQLVVQPPGQNILNIYSIKRATLKQCVLLTSLRGSVNRLLTILVETVVVKWQNVS